MAAIDIAGFVSELKDHAIDHGFHVHDERHFVETYSLRQTWEVDLHPEEACGGPLDLHLALEVDPRTLLSFEDLVNNLPEDDDPPDTFHFPLVFNWALPPLPKGPDLLIYRLAGIGGTQLPEVSAIDSYPSARRARAQPGHLLADRGVARPGVPRPGADVRRARHLPGGQPLPPAERRGLAGRQQRLTGV